MPTHTCVIVVSFLDQLVDYKLLKTVPSLLLPTCDLTSCRTLHAQQSDAKMITLWVPSNRKNINLSPPSSFLTFLLSVSPPSLPPLPLSYSVLLSSHLSLPSPSIPLSPFLPLPPSHHIYQDLVIALNVLT